jgi:hypothetical protein
MAWNNAKGEQPGRQRDLPLQWRDSFEATSRAIHCGGWIVSVDWKSHDYEHIHEDRSFTLKTVCFPWLCNTTVRSSLFFIICLPNSADRSKIHMLSRSCYSGDQRKRKWEDSRDVRSNCSTIEEHGLYCAGTCLWRWFLFQFSAWWSSECMGGTAPFQNPNWVEWGGSQSSGNRQHAKREILRIFVIFGIFGRVRWLITVG